MSEHIKTPTIKLVKTKTLKMYYVQLPVIDLSYRFLYRFEEPVATIWRKGGIDLSLYEKPTLSLDSELKEYGLVQWLKMLKPTELTAETAWLAQVDSVELIECEIVPKVKP